MKSRAEQAEPARGIVTSAKPKAPLIGASAGGLEEAALHAMYAQIIEASADAIYSYDLGGCILTWNTGAEKLYGYAASASARVMRSARIIAWAAARSEGSK